MVSIISLFFSNILMNRKVFDSGVVNKIMGSHKLNMSSSRSHTLFTITVERSPKRSESFLDPIIGENSIPRNIHRTFLLRFHIVCLLLSSFPFCACIGKLTLVDLAGSERLNTISGSGQTDPVLLKESIEINRSLLSLGKVITALADSGGEC